MCLQGLDMHQLIKICVYKAQTGICQTRFLSVRGDSVSARLHLQTQTWICRCAPSQDPTQKDRKLELQCVHTLHVPCGSTRLGDQICHICE